MSRMGFVVNCIDIRKLIIPDLIIDSLSKYEINQSNIPVLKKQLPQSKPQSNQILDFLKKELDIHYNAPQDAKNTAFSNQYFDFISSTLTLCFIPKNDLEKILIECYRILKLGGVMSVTIDYQDNWSYIDNKITGYNFLLFNYEQWKKYNPGIHFQNRLRHKDYLQMFEKIGFKIVSEKHRSPEDADLEKLRNLNIDSSFSSYTLNELGVKDGEIVVVKNK